MRILAGLCSGAGGLHRLRSNLNVTWEGMRDFYLECVTVINLEFMIHIYIHTYYRELDTIRTFFVFLFAFGLELKCSKKGKSNILSA